MYGSLKRRGTPLFQYFKYLPLATRHTIWLQSFCPRIVEIHCNPETSLCDVVDSSASSASSSESGGNTDPEGDIQDYISAIDPASGRRFLSRCPPPAVLSVSQESREFALNHYQLCFGTRAKPASIYINPSIDVVYFAFEYARTLTSYIAITNLLPPPGKLFLNKYIDQKRRAELKSIKNIAWRSKLLDSDGETASMNWSSFPSLETVTLVLETKDRQDSVGNEAFVAPSTEEEISMWNDDLGFARTELEDSDNARKWTWRVVSIRRGEQAIQRADHDQHGISMQGPNTN